MREAMEAERCMSACIDAQGELLMVLNAGFDEQCVYDVKYIYLFSPASEGA